MTKNKPSLHKDALREPPTAYGGEIVLYQAPDGSVRLHVRLEKETLWLSLNQMATLFERDKSVISRHLRNVFREGELDRESVVAFFATTAADGKTYNVEYYNLDAIISVGYRVNSKRGTQFRIWATQVLRDHILKGYTVNACRLQELKQTIKLVASVTDRRTLSSDEATALLRVVHDYAFALDVLDDYDHGRVPQPISGQAAGTPGGRCRDTGTLWRRGAASQWLGRLRPGVWRMSFSACTFPALGAAPMSPVRPVPANTAQRRACFWRGFRAI